MKLLEETFVSVYEKRYSKNPKVASIYEVLSSCIRPVYANEINIIRRYYQEGDNNTAQRLKGELPGFTPCGTFNGGHAAKNLVQLSGLVVLDYDHVPDRTNVIKCFAQDEHTVAAIESPTDGVKVFAYVEGLEGRHREAMNLVNEHYRMLTGLSIDISGTDVSRLCYLTYSPNGYIATLYKPFVLPEVQQLAVDNNFTDTVQEANEEPAPLPQVNYSQEEVETFIKSYSYLNPLVEGQRHSNLFKLACEAARRGFDQNTILREAEKLFSFSEFPRKEINQTVVSAYQTVSTFPTTHSQAAESRSQKEKVTKVTKVPYSTAEFNDDTEEAYWEGEEYRKGTPTFDESVYTNLPNLLNDALLDDANDRERDVSFLSNLIALSSALPSTFGLYNHKRYSPHCYGMCIAPSASSKSSAQTGRYLLEELHDQILLESNHRLKAYNNDYTSWMMECNVNKRKGEKIPPEPEKPPYRMHFIPASVSYTRMQIQLRDNGSQGGIIFDTEADTLSTANKLDCGNFDDMLRKAFEHENIDSLYKANGMQPICIRHPKLALFLTGTPGQLSALLEHSEKGLPNRILAYTYRSETKWKEMNDDYFSIEDLYKPLAHQVVLMNKFCEANPVIFHLRRTQWNTLNEIFSKLLMEVAMEGNDDLQAVVKRYAFLVMRISMIFSRIRQYESQVTDTEIYSTDEDFERALHLVLCCYEHNKLVLASLPIPNGRPLKNPDSIRQYIEDLPSVFTTEEAILTGEKHKFSIRKVHRLLKSLNELKIKRICHGRYEKLN